MTYVSVVTHEGLKDHRRPSFSTEDAYMTWEEKGPGHGASICTDYCCSTPGSQDAERAVSLLTVGSSSPES